MSLSLNWETMSYGFHLTFPKTGHDAGDIHAVVKSEYGQAIRWQFQAPDGTEGPLRTVRQAAEYDALAYWSEKNRVKER